MMPDFLGEFNRVMICRHTVILSVIFFLSAQPAPSSPAPQHSGNSKDVVLRAARPKYPKDAQGYYPKGSGIVLMEVDKKVVWLSQPEWKKVRAIKFWMTPPFKPAINGALNPVRFPRPIGPLRFGITVVEYVTAWLAQLSQTECLQSAYNPDCWPFKICS